MPPALPSNKYRCFLSGILSVHTFPTLTRNVPSSFQFASVKRVQPTLRSAPIRSHCLATNPSLVSNYAWALKSTSPVCNVGCELMKVNTLLLFNKLKCNTFLCSCMHFQFGENQNETENVFKSSSKITMVISLNSIYFSYTQIHQYVWQFNPIFHPSSWCIANKVVHYKWK